MMVDVSQEILDNIFGELASLKGEVALLKAMGRAPAEGELINLKKAAGIARCSDEWVRRWLIKGAEFGRKVGGPWQVDAAQFHEWLAARKAYTGGR